MFIIAPKIAIVSKNNEEEFGFIPRNLASKKTITNGAVVKTWHHNPKVPGSNPHLYKIF
jgi:hypothetical protein